MSYFMASCFFLRENILWHLEYNGFGSFELMEDGFLLQTRVPELGKTHGALVLYQPESSSEHFQLSLEYSFVKQLRKKDPNPWESLWIMFNYQRGHRADTKDTLYLALKTNGVELGRAFPERLPRIYKNTV